MKLQLTGPQLQRIREAIVAAYSGAGPNALAALNMVLTDNLDKTVYDFVPVNVPFPLQVAELLARANGEGWLPNLLGAVQQDRPDVTDLQEIIRSFMATAPAQQVLSVAARTGAVAPEVRAELEQMLPGGAIVQLDTMQRRVRCVCRVDYADWSPPGNGTGFLVGPDLVLTNWHVLKRVIDAPGTAKELRFRFDLLDSAAAPDAGGRVARAKANGSPVVRWSPGGGEELKGGAGEPTMQELDYALVRLDERVGDDPVAGGGTRGYIVLQKAMPQPPVDSGLMVLQHPLRGPLQFAMGRVLGLNETGSRLQHTAATQTGSSGGLVLDSALGPVALHNGSRSDTGRAAQPFNTAVPLAHIVADLVGAGVTEMLSEPVQAAYIKTLPEGRSPNQREGVVEPVSSQGTASQLDHDIAGAKVNLSSKRPEERYMSESKRRAIIIGINDYQDKSITALNGAHNDASELYERLKNPQIGNFQISDDHYLIGEQATCDNIRKALSDVFWKTDHNDLAIFYFSGHGFVDNYGDGYIAPYNIIKDEPFVCGIHMQELKEVISKPNNTCVLMILDCCYSGIATKGVKSVTNFRTIYEKNLEDLSGKGRIILASSEENEISREIILKHSNTNEPAHFHGIFTFSLIEGLDGKAADIDGVISFDGLSKYLHEQLEFMHKQQPKFHMVDASELSQIIIGISPEKRSEYIQKKIVEARDLHNNYRQDLYIGYVIDAVKALDIVLKADINNNEAAALKNNVTTTLDECALKIRQWLVVNEQYVRRYISANWREIDDLVTFLTFDRVMTLESQKIPLLSQLYHVCMGNMSNEEFIKRIRAATGPYTSLPSPLSVKLT